MGKKKFVFILHTWEYGNRNRGVQEFDKELVTDCGVHRDGPAPSSRRPALTPASGGRSLPGKFPPRGAQACAACPAGSQRRPRGGSWAGSLLLPPRDNELEGGEVGPPEGHPQHRPASRGCRGRALFVQRRMLPTAARCTASITLFD